MVEINIAKDYTKTPGGRFKKDGKFSGEEFRNNYLEPKYLEALKNNDVLNIDLDGGYGYGSSFLEEAFGGLIRKLIDDSKKVDINIIKIKSEEEPQLIEDINKYMKNALKNHRGKKRE